MPVARFWRAVGFDVDGVGLSLSAAFLTDASGARVDADSVISSQLAPAFGQVSNLADGDLASTCSWASGDARSAGFSLNWDCGQPVEVDGLVLGGVSRESWSTSVALEYYSGTGWVREADASGLDYPGASTLTKPVAKMPMMLIEQGLVGAPVLDMLGHVVTAMGGAGHSDQQVLAGLPVLKINGLAGGSIRVAGSDFSFGASSFVFDSWFYIEGNSLSDVDGARWFALCSTFNNNGAGFTIGVLGDSAQTGTGLQFDMWESSGRATLYRVETPVAQGVWHHVEVSHSTGTRRIFFNGVQVNGVQSNIGVGTSLANAPDSFIVLGATNNSSYPARLNGYLCAPRFRLGVGHTSSFTPVLPLYAKKSASRRKTFGIKSRCAAAAHVGLHTMPQSSRCRVLVDAEFGGTGRIWGTTKTRVTETTTVPTRARIVLLHQRSKLLVRETWSDVETGAFEFNGIDTNQQFITLAEDAAGVMRPVAANMLAPEVSA